MRGGEAFISFQTGHALWEGLGAERPGRGVAIVNEAVKLYNPAEYIELILIGLILIRLILITVK